MKKKKKLKKVDSQTVKRKSYRAKAKDYNQTKIKKNLKKPLKSSREIPIENQNIEILKKQKKAEKDKDGGISDSQTIGLVF